MIRVELSGYADRIIKKHQRSFYGYREKHHGFGRMFDEGQLKLVIVSPNETTLRDLADLIPQNKFYPPSSLYFCEELKQFISKGGRDAA